MSTSVPGRGAPRAARSEPRSIPGHVRAIVQRADGSTDVLTLEQRAAPTVKERQVLVRVRAAAVHPADWAIPRGLPYVLRLGYGVARSAPKDLQHETRARHAWWDICPGRDNCP